MKRVNTILAITLLILTGCGTNNQSTDVLITINVTSSYPKKELVLQDFMDVEYIALETTDEFLCRGFVKALGKEIILISRAGDILIFNRSGKGIRTINRQGRGSEEYLNLGMAKIILDEDNDEMFVNDFIGNKIMVYDFYGKFKRSIPYAEGIRYENVYNFDRENLICDDSSFRIDDETPDKYPFMIISKQDGSIVNDIQIPYKQKKTASMTVLVDANRGMVSYASYRYFPIIPYHEGWILTEPSSDTVFRFLSDYSMIPFMVRTPSIQSMNPEVLLLPRMLTERYYFVEILKKEQDFTSADLVYDIQEKTIYEYTLYNGDYSNKKIIKEMQKNMSDGIVFWQEIAADELVESYKKGELKGKLKEVAAELEDDSNPVIMLVKNKKM